MAWNGSGEKTSSHADIRQRTSKRPLPWFIISALIVLFIGGAFLQFRFNTPIEETHKGYKEKVVNRKIMPVKQVKPRSTTKVASETKVKTTEETHKSKKEEWKMPAVLQTEQIEDGLVLCEVPSNMPSHARNPYKSQVESLLSMLGKPGTPYTPVPIDPNMDLDGDFLKAMENTIIVWEDESEQSEQHKLMVNWMKQAIAEAKKEGWKVGDLLRELEKERKHQWQMLSEAQTILSETEEKQPEQTAVIRKALNKELDEIGVDPLKKTETEELVEQEELKANKQDNQ